jgi:cytidylate kinase
MITPGVEKIVERQVRRWFEQQRAAERRWSRVESEMQRPMVALSREYGGLGLEVARFAADRLGFDLYDQQLLEEVLEASHVQRKVIESLDEATRRRIDDWIGEQFGGGAFAESEYLRNLSRILLTIGRHGGGVVVGRGAHYILDPQATLRVRVFAPLEVRVARIAEREGLSPHQARSRVFRIDAERNAFAWRHFNKDISDSRHYDLLVNTGTLPVVACATLVADSFRARFGESDSTKED